MNIAVVQFNEAKGNNPKITCSCGWKGPVRFAYKCYFCNKFFCVQCAPLHFRRFSMLKILRKFMCWFWGHDPCLVMAGWKNGRYVSTYSCDCGKKVEFDETIIHLDYLIIRQRFEKAPNVWKGEKG